MSQNKIEIDEKRWSEILSNQGFADTEKWYGYARKHDFNRIHSTELTSCPDCGCEFRKTIGHYIYYSTFINIQLCQSCNLAYSDRRIDMGVISKHFDVAYKDEAYFQNARRDIFDQIVELICAVAPDKGNVLDIGAAKGHMMGILKRNRPDLDITVNDISKSACETAERIYNFKTICAPISSLQAVKIKYDVVVLVDVIYYEMDIKKLWKLLCRLLKKDGYIIIRNPNKYGLIRYSQLLIRVLSLQNKYSYADKIRFFNPEHIYLFARNYFYNRLKGLGFSHIKFKPSKLLLTDDGRRFFFTTFYLIAKLIHILSIGKLIITPSLLITAKLNK